MKDLFTKKNVGTFNADVKENGGYLYTTHAQLSACLANKRITDAVVALVSNAESIIDIGCGDGIYTEELQQRFPRAHIEGVDPAYEAIAFAQQKYPHIVFKVGNILEDTVDLEKKFGVAILRGVLHHLTDQEKAIKNAFKFSDTVLIIEPNGNNPILKLIEKLSPYHRAHEEQSFTSWKLQGWCRNVSATVTHTGYIGFIPFFFPDILTKIVYSIQPILEKIPLVREFPSAQIVLVARKN